MAARSSTRNSHTRPQLMSVHVGWPEFIRLLDYVMLLIAVCALLSAISRQYFATSPARGNGSAAAYSAKQVRSVEPAGQAQPSQLVSPPG